MSETVFDWQDADGNHGFVDADGKVAVLSCDGEFARVWVETPGQARRLAEEFRLLAVHLEPLESAAAKPRGRR